MRQRTCLSHAVNRRLGRGKIPGLYGGLCVGLHRVQRQSVESDIVEHDQRLTRATTVEQLDGETHEYGVPLRGIEIRDFAVDCGAPVVVAVRECHVRRE